MAVNLSPIWGAGAQLLDNSGNVLSGGKIYTYAAGTTTPATTYTSSSGVTANSNPIILNSAGRVPFEIWLTDGVVYKFVLKDSNDTLIATYDNLVGINSNFIAYTAQQEIQTATAGQTVFNLTTMQYQPGTNNLSVFVDGVNQYGPGAQYAYVETDTDTVTFVSGLHVGASVKFTTASPVSSNSTDANNVSFTGVKGQTGAVADLGTMDGSDWVGFQPDGTGAVSSDYSIQDKLRQTVSVKDFGAVGDGVTDDTAAIQAALEYWRVNKCDLLFPSGNTFSVSSSLVVDFSTTSSHNKRIIGYGSTLVGSGFTGNILTITVSGALTLVRNLIIEGLSIIGSTNGAALVMQGPLASDSYLYNNTIRNCTLSNLTGLKLLGNFFESLITDNVISANTTGYGIYIDTAGGSGSGSGGVISSLMLSFNNIRGGINCVRSTSTSGDVNILGGTYLLAQQEGIHIENAAGGFIQGCHVEANWVSNPVTTSGQAAIFAAVSGTFSIKNIYCVFSNGQSHSVRVYSVGCAILDSGVIFGSGLEEYYLWGTAAGSILINGLGSYTTPGTVSIYKNNGIRAIPPISSKNVFRVGSPTSVTPSSSYGVYHVILGSGTPAINLPSFTPQSGDELEFIFEQAGGGSGTVTWDAGYKVNGFVPTTGYSSISSIRFKYINTQVSGFKWVAVSKEI